jgi:hypothetical protein
MALNGAPSMAASELDDHGRAKVWPSSLREYLLGLDRNDLSWIKLSILACAGK